MKILTVDIGTGTQDILLYDSRLDLENGFKLILPSPTMMIYRQIQEATRVQAPLLLTGVMMGGGPSQWAAERHLQAGLPVYATPEAARTFNDDLNRVTEMGVQIVSEEEAGQLPASIRRLELRDFDFGAIEKAFQGFGVRLTDLTAVAVAVFDHGAAPPDVSDRQFRFDYLDRRIRARNSLSAFAYLSPQIPEIMTRLQAVAKSAQALDCPLVVMDTGPAAVLGATFDARVAQRERKIIVNVGNFHTIAFRLGDGIEGIFEHHTGEIDIPKLEKYLHKLADGTLQHQDVFNDMGHGALIYGKVPLEFGPGDFDVVVTGPRRGLFEQRASRRMPHSLRPYFAVPFGDMMIAGCFGLLAAAAELMPEWNQAILGSLYGNAASGMAPWDVDG